MSYPPSSPGGAPHPWAPRGPGDTSATSTWAPPAAPPSPSTGAWSGGAGATGAWAPPAQPPGASRPWAPTGWSGGYPSGPPAAGTGAMPPHPPGYRAPAGGGHRPPGPAPTPAPPAGDRGSRLMSALVGGLVGAVVAALVAAGLVLATDDDDPVQEATTSTTEASGGSTMGVGESLDIQQILDIAQPSVVSINTESGAGSGFVYDATEGFILTNAHVIAGAEEISVTFFDGSAMGAELVGAFPNDDVAMLRVEGVDALVAADLGSSDALRVGEDVVAIGNALGLGGKPTVTTGIVSALNRSIPNEDGEYLENLIQTDAAINPGNSGGPLVNSQGQVVGINTAKFDDASNIGFALAIDSILPLIEDLRDGNGEVTADTPTLGVSVEALAGADIPPEALEQFGITEQAGLIIVAVSPGSGAEQAGLQMGDVIREVDGATTDVDEDLSAIIRAKAIGDTVVVGFDRLGVRDEVEVTLT
ncbi:MAG TPA: trypsin-like peptidase domain-containing protein [Iamia sp.]